MLDPRDRAGCTGYAGCLQMVDRDHQRSDAPRRSDPTRQPRIIVEQPIEPRLDLNKSRSRLHDRSKGHLSRDVFRRTQDKRDHRRDQQMGVGNERIAHMLMAEAAPLEDDVSEALPQPGSLLHFSAQQRDAFAVFPHAGQGVAEFGLRLICGSETVTKRLATSMTAMLVMTA